MSDAADRVLDLRPAELLLADIFVQGGLADIRPGHKHMAEFVNHDDEVRQGRRIDCAAGARPHNGGNLWHDAGHDRIAVKNFAVAMFGVDTFLDAATAGIMQADDGAAGFQRQIEYFADLGGMHFSQRAAKNGEVIRVHIDEAPIDFPIARDDPVAVAGVFLHAEVDATVLNKTINFNKSPRIKQECQAFPNKQLPLLVLFVDLSLSASQIIFLRCLAKSLDNSTHFRQIFRPPFIN